ncbi:MAG: carbohydrate binding domain-containing protein [Armatimonadetes bacterium]|nr:carbohydrate binding domain-containing protein [Armatimonadota bacterium]
MRILTKLIPVLLCLLPVAMTACMAADNNLIQNNSFEQVREGQAVPDRWTFAGAAEITQQLTVDKGRDGRNCAKLDCTHFEGSAPNSHVMLCQQGAISVQRGKWYQLTFWAKAERIKSGAVNVALVNSQVWRNVGLSEVALVKPKWARYEFLFQAKEDLPTEASRFQFWFNSAGTFWLDEVALVETTGGRQWYPQIATESVQNFVPNSSYECGGANWGSFTYGLRGWGGNLYRLYGEPDATTAAHGKQSWKLALTPATLPVFYFDYFEAVKQPVQRVLLANLGWFVVKPGETLCLSAFLRSDDDNAVAQILINQAEGRSFRQQIKVSGQWKRYQLTLTPDQSFLYLALGLDLEASKLDSATLWLDAVQLERGNKPTEYAPRSPLEAFIESEVQGNLFTKAKGGMSLTVRAFNNDPAPQQVRKQLVVTDFFDQPVVKKEITLSVPSRQSVSQNLRGLCAGRQGYFRLQWDADSVKQSLRCSVLEPFAGGDSPFGMNHAYPWQFLVEEARLAGILWWRDWTAKWHVVEPEKGKFNWKVPDEQIYRVTDLGAKILALLPFPSSLWATTAREEEVQETYKKGGESPEVLRIAYAPRDLKDFGNYAAEAVRHYRGTIRVYHLLNEPIYTTYALPRAFGYKLQDYLRLLEVAHGSMKAVDPKCVIVGGIAAPPEADLVRQFVELGGMKYVDVVDMHVYHPPVGATFAEEAFKEHLELMRKHGGPKPIWITEYGCYADDDPPCIPHSVGDETMNHCRWPNEREAAEHVVKFTAMSFAYGVRKIFFHAGTCGTINNPDAGGVFFEYGGAPRKVLAAVAALTRLFGIPDECITNVDRNGMKGYLFRTGGKAVAVAWSNDDREHKLKRPSGVRAFDLMGNELKARDLTVSTTPVYLLGRKDESRAIARMLNG